jgi:hypothetical protein
MTKEVYMDMLETLVIPAIKEVWPMKMQTIHLQDDNAPAHRGVLEAAIARQCAGDSWPMAVRRQPPNSPDFNVLDLGYFRAIQSLHYQNTSSCIDSLVTSVLGSFQELDPVVLDNTFYTLMSVL